MPDILYMINSLQKIKVADLIQEAMYQTAHELVMYQRSQLLHGEKRTGGKIGKYKNPAYARVKFAMNPLAEFGYVDLTLHKNFSNDIFADVRQGAVFFDSADSKTPDIEEKYGTSIWGLNQHYASDYSLTYLAPKFVEIFKNSL